MLLAGWLSDTISKGKRGPMNVVFSLGLLVSILGLWGTRDYFVWWIDGTFLFIIGFFLFGPQMMIGLAAAELSHKKQLERLAALQDGSPTSEQLSPDIL